MTAWGVVLFHTTSDAFRAEKTLARAGLPAKLVPTPREYSSDCGLALRFSWPEASRVRGLLQEAGISPDGLRELA